MLTSFDDYPIHQTAEPVAQPASGDRNVYDRYFFNGYSRDGDLFFAAALGLYPNRGVMTSPSRYPASSRCTITTAVTNTRRPSSGPIAEAMRAFTSRRLRHVFADRRGCDARERGSRRRSDDHRS